MTVAALHPLVRKVVDTYLAIVGSEVPNLVEGLYLVGSVALDDFRPSVSDIDFVGVTQRPLSAADTTALERVHAALAARHRRPFFDGAVPRWTS
jgi:Nucleotidyltransferase domain